MNTRVRSVVRDTAEDFITDTDINGWLQEADLDLAARLELLHGENTEAAEAIGADDNTIALPSDCLRVLSLRLGSDGDDAVMVDDAVWNSWNDSGGTPVPSIYRIFRDSIEVYPTPDEAESYRLRFVRSGAVMSSDGSTSDLPEHLHIRHIAYARAEALQKAGEFAHADREMARYEDGLPPRSLGKELLIPGPISVYPAPGPWDWPEGEWDPEAAS